MRTNGFWPRQPQGKKKPETNRHPTTYLYNKQTNRQTDRQTTETTSRIRFKSLQSFKCIIFSPSAVSVFAARLSSYPIVAEQVIFLLSVSYLCLCLFLFLFVVLLFVVAVLFLFVVCYLLSVVNFLFVVCCLNYLTQNNTNNTITRRQ